MTDDERRAGDLAIFAALREVVLRLIADVYVADDPEETRRRLVTFEEAVTAALDRPLYPGANEATDSYMRAVATSYVSELVGSIVDVRRSG
ncbi:hypothetical protein E3C22_16705 [Jiella endophytica]|uniref:Uncharacterized protein n=1 Tax=Jiella endophytica TaxID=2558362 RepID=A0A4Y8RFD7_9HYPH|nr:hypothetical protein [Jiella endophytica]TFF20548.1 hypothetical protein E3C22_16705 [Jiella endophytica]